MASALTRTLEPGITSNRFIMVVTPLASAVAGLGALLTGDALQEAIPFGLGSGGVAFIAWAAARELDPDHPLSAGMAALIAAPLVVIGSPDLLGPGLVVLIGRLVAGTTGRLPTRADVIVLVVGAGLVAYRDVGPAFVSVATVGVIAVAVLEPRVRGRMLLAAAGMAGFAAVIGWLAGRSPTGPATPGGGALVLLWAGCAVAMVSLVVLGRLVAHADSASGGFVQTRRVRVARATVAAAAVAPWLWVGAAGVTPSIALWAALAGTVAGWGVRPLLNRRPLSVP
jgi:hypothetical protein